MDDNLDEYQTIANSSEFRWVHPIFVRRKMDTFSCTYTVEVQTLQPRYISKSRKIVEEDHCRYDIICANLNIADNTMAKSCLADLMEERMYQDYSIVAIEIETERVLGVLVALERSSYKNVKPDELEDQELEKDILYIEELRCLLLNRARGSLSKRMRQVHNYLEVLLLCGSRQTSNHFQIETMLIDALIKLAKSKKIKFILVISDYRKHQLHFLSLGFVKVSEMAYGTINGQFEQKKFPKTDASTSIMCLLYKFPDKSRFTTRHIFPIKWSVPVRRATRLKLAFH